jgi:nicotinate-nucleotide pyrophosphorylase (carboxylating)
MDFRRQIRAALKEDHAWDDVTSRAFVPAHLQARACIIAKHAGVAAGVQAAAETFRLRDPRCRVRILKPDGRSVRKGDRILEVRGPLRSLLSAERTALNFLTHLSGVATLTRSFVAAAGRNGPRILDTRKTLPGLRALQKAAVRCGGGASHRAHLADAVLIKENHLSWVRDEPSLAILFRHIQRLRRRGFQVEMECQDKKQVLWGLLSGADILLLDNFAPARLPGLVRWIRSFCRRKKFRRPLLEVSGGVTLDTIRSLARSGVDRVSIGRLTHSAPALDMSLDVDLS